MKFCKDCGYREVAIDEGSREELDQCIECWRKLVRKILPIREM